ncbi:SDR family NAD(P)-dependent oxidoreductase [Fulvivirgaceae bacterium BMA12]|uniref:SDR family NAD(P)-dependent oxidoreductase n=1 Tax=Agaribacillus aureus TaxID=3051825 RepID=A0ABT8LI77_9BACT|nr:SDR family NAD(P)-dependent oxidoreductase [Fulvivirgaceae bacterium BMA12]
MDLNIQNQVVIVTGGSEGIGEGIVRSIVREGGIPVITGRDKRTGENLVNEFQNERKEAFFIEVSLSSIETCQMVVDKTLDRYGRINALVNNDALNDGVGLENGSPDQFQRSLLSNLGHYYHLAYYCLDALKKTKGTIINISSKTALTGQGNTSGYAASKGAQLALTKAWSEELNKYGIRVNAIVPTEVKRMTTIEETGDIVAFLISESAIKTTGEFIFVNDGYAHLDQALSR